MPLATPQFVLAHDDDSFRFLSGCAAHVSRMLSFPNVTKTHQLSLAGQDLTLRIVNGSLFQAQYAGDSMVLRQYIPGFQPIRLMLPGNRPYILSFFYGNLLTLPDRGTTGFLYYRSGGILQFALDGQTFGIFDADTNGYYRPASDGIGFDAGGPFSVFAPLGKMLSTRTAVYEIARLAEDGSELELKPVTDKTGTLNLAFAGLFGTECKLAFWSSESQLGLAMPVAPTGSSAMKVLPGKYSLRYGLAYNHNLRKLVARVSQGRMQPIDVAAGPPRPTPIGGPFTLEFTYRLTDSKLDIGPKDAHLFGKAGEEYIDLTWRTEPEIGLSINGRIIPLGRMQFG